MRQWIGSAIGLAGGGVVGKIVLGVVVAVILGFTAWAFRVDALRGEHLQTITLTSEPLEQALCFKSDKVKRKQAAPDPLCTRSGEIKHSDMPKAVAALVESRDQWKSSALKWRGERDSALLAIEDQNSHIIALSEQATRLREEAKAREAQVAKLVRDRNFWIKEAEQAASRVERRAAEEELAEVEEVLNELRRQGF